jgi:hypothetical protein
MQSNQASRILNSDDTWVEPNLQAFQTHTNVISDSYGVGRADVDKGGNSSKLRDPDTGVCATIDDINVRCRSDNSLQIVEVDGVICL